LSKGVFTTADLAELREGCVFLRGRAGDLINVAGRKLHPESIELAIERHPLVHQCVVFGVPDAERGERIAAVVNGAPDCDAELLRSHLGQFFAPWQVPKEWWFTPTLQADTRGKLSRSQWRERFLARHSTPDH
jgi:acyl-CoA synthetase (AMP-forming)/AMP-acid ligase II